jgi:hypothetical protein
MKMTVFSIGAMASVRRRAAIGNATAAPYRTAAEYGATVLTVRIAARVDGVWRLGRHAR